MGVTSLTVKTYFVYKLFVFVVIFIRFCSLQFSTSNVPLFVVVLRFYTDKGLTHDN